VKVSSLYNESDFLTKGVKGISFVKKKANLFFEAPFLINKTEINISGSAYFGAYSFFRGGRVSSLEKIGRFCSVAPGVIIGDGEHPISFLSTHQFQYSGKGFDCSGFTQTVFRHNGFLLPRDANMQVELGEEVSFEDGFAQVQPGDLLYFGGNGRITHVGISLGGARFIHASSYVMMNSLDEADSDYDDYRRRTLVVIKRL
jgi:hypothetical protein